MATIPVSLEDLPQRISADMRAREHRVGAALVKTAKAGEPIAKARAPVAFEELRDSIHAKGKQLISDAPHSGAAENGSRPHYPPLAPLVAWVKLRGMQALHGGAEGPTGAAHAANIGAELGARARGGANSVDDPVRIARAIQHAIGQHGTRPHFFMGGSIPDIMKELDGFVRAALPDQP